MRFRYIFAALFIAILTARQVLEFYISVPPTGAFFVDASTFLHSAIFYTWFFVALSLCVAHFAKWSFADVWVRFMKLSPLLLAAPIVDWIFFGRYGVSMSYHFVQPVEFIEHFFSFFGPMTVGGVTFGMRVQVLGMLGLVGIWVYRARVSIGDAILSVIGTYAAVYVIASAPSFVGWMHLGGLYDSVAESVFSAVNTNVARVRDWGVGQALTTLRFNMLMAQIWFLALVAVAVYSARRSIFTLYGKSRAIRAGLYVGLFVLGALQAPSYILGIQIGVTAATIIATLTAIVSVVAAWTYAFVINDVHDLAADRVVHPERALPRGIATRTSATRFALAAAAMAFVGSILLPGKSVVGIGIFLVCATLYSVPPFQLRRFFIVPQILMAVASLSIFYTGHELVSKDVILGSVGLFMISLGLLLFGFWFLKDMPDAEGDGRAGYRTVMTLFGAHRGPWVAYGIFSGSLLLSLVFLHTWPQVIIWGLIHGVLYLLLRTKRLSDSSMLLLLCGYVIALLL